MNYEIDKPAQAMYSAWQFHSVVHYRIGQILEPYLIDSKEVVIFRLWALFFQPQKNLVRNKETSWFCFLKFHNSNNFPL